MLARLIRDIGNYMFLKILNRWVAGDSIEDALSYCQDLNNKGSTCIVNYLGEHYTEISEVFSTVKEYKRLIDKIARVKGSVTIKPSQLGFNVLERKDSEKFCEQQMLEIVEHARKKRVFVWLDMEGPQSTEFTVRFYRKHIKNYKMGICLQANMFRTEKDLQSLMELSKKEDVRVRLVKGIYKGDITDPHELHLKFLSLISIAFEENKLGLAIGSHHTQAIELAIKLQEENRKRFFEIQVLKGVLPDYYAELRESGINVTEYVPYGKDAFAYSVRRAIKNPSFSKSILFAPFFDAYRKLYG